MYVAINNWIYWLSLMWNMYTVVPLISAGVLFIVFHFVFIYIRKIKRLF